MPVELDQYDRACLGGDLGGGPQLAMSILVRMAELWEATRLLDISRAHIDSALYMGDATLEFAERLAGMDARVSVPTTLNVSGVDVAGWRDWAVPEEWAEKARRQMEAYEAMGCASTWTCTPYQLPDPPGLGEQIAWGESNAVAFANSVLGARTQQYPDLLDICAAITGRAPAAGLHLEENRAGELLLRLEGIPGELQAHDTFAPVLGHLVGKLAGERVPVVDGLTVEPDEDALKAMAAAVASSGAVSLFHLVGITPEAPDLETAFRGGPVPEPRTVDLAKLRAARHELSTAGDDGLDLVALGSPHFSLAEFRRLAPLLEDRRCHDDVVFLVTSGRAMVGLAEEAGLLEPLRRFGGRLTVDTCILTSPMLSDETEVIMTNSAKYAYYSPGLLGASVVFGSLEDCVRSAEAGRVVREESPWDA